MLIVFITGLGAAACNAGSSILQRLATGRPRTDELFGRKFFVGVSKHPLFLLGLGLQAGAAVLQAIALSQGPISVVEPLLTTDLVFLLILLSLRSNLHAGVREWGGVGAIIIGLSGLFLATRPQGGTAQYALAPWIFAMVAAALLIAVCMAAAKKTRSVKLRAAVVSLAAAGAYAVNAGLAKLTLHQFKTGGIQLVASSWPVYVLIGCGIVAIYLMQNMYGAGPLAVSQPVVETLEPAFSVAIGIIIFGETLRHTPLALALGAICAAVLLGGIAALGSSQKISPNYTGENT